MKICIAIILFGLLLGCSLKDDRFIRKEINKNDICVKWYFYSYISNNSPDIVEVTKDSTVEIYRASGLISDILIKNKTIIIKQSEPSSGIIYTKKILPDIFGYKIMIDTTATFKEYSERPLGTRE